MRHWLGSVLHKLRAQGGRVQGRRAEHEIGAAREESLPTALDVVERVASQRALARAVLELDEPYRSRLLLRYYDERSPREIARSTGDGAVRRRRRARPRAARPAPG